MNLYLKNLLPRLRQYGKKLNQIELFVDRTWILVDESGAVRTYRFKRNNTLRISTNGNFTDSRWELEGLDAIAVTTPGQPYGEIFRHGFVLNGLLVVQKEGTAALPTIFYDEAVVPDGDVQGYIFRELINQMQLRKVRNNEGYYMSGADGDAATVGKPVYDANLEPVGTAELNLGNKIVHVRDGRIVRITNILQFTDRDHAFEVYSEGQSPKSGDKIFRSQFVPSDGMYKVRGANGFYKFDVEGGVIKKVRTTDYATFVIVGAIAVVLIPVVIVNVVKNQGSPEPRVAAVTEDTQEPTTVSPTVDTPDTAAYVSQTSSIPDAPDEYKKNELKRVVTQYFDNINSRNWSEVSNALPITVKNYFGNSEIHYTEVLQKLREYWGEDRTTGIAYDMDDMQVQPIEGGYRVTAQVVERGTEGFYRTPVWVSADLFIDINHGSKIFGVYSKVKKTSYDVYRMFRLSEDIRIEDYKQRNNTSDWYSILEKVKTVANETPSEYPKYREAVLEVYGEFSRVTVNGVTYYLGEYLDKLSRGEETETYFYRVITNEAGGKDLSK